MLKLLLHTCCAVCALGALNKLTTEKQYLISLYFYNPNIDTKEEYYKRVNELEKLCARFDINKIYIEDYISKSTLIQKDDIIKHIEKGQQCQICITYRLQKTAEFVIANNYDVFTTTLTTSPHKDALFINKIGAEISAVHKTSYLIADFKKQNGFLIAIQLAKELNIYRQNYCGCMPR